MHGVPPLSSSQLQIVRRIAAIGKQVGASPKEVKAALETGRVEANFSNPTVATDHDSTGWRQERASLYPNPSNLDASIRRFFKETKAVKHKYDTAGALAAAVQRPAAQYRGRYQGVSGEADSLLKQYFLGGASSGGRTGAGSSGLRSVPVSASSTATVAGQVPDTGGSGLADLLAGLSKPSVQPVQSVPIEAPSTSSDRYLTGVAGIQPTGVMPGAASSGVAQQLAALVGPGADIGLPSQSASATASGTLKLPTGKLPPSAAASPATGVVGGTSAKGGAASAVAWAQSTVGVAETAGANRGARIDQWEQRFGMKAQPWCAMFTSLAATKGGMAASGRTAGVAVVRAQAQKGSAAYQRGFVDPQNAKAGDLILFGNDHIGMVERNTGKGLVMIAGNDSNKVNRRTIAYGNGDIVRPKYGRR